jgi:hypothetical protein
MRPHKKHASDRKKQIHVRGKPRWTTEETGSAVRDHMNNIFSWAIFICSAVHSRHSADDDEPSTAAGTGGTIHGCGPEIFDEMKSSSDTYLFLCWNRAFSNHVRPASSLASLRSLQKCATGRHRDMTAAQSLAAVRVPGPAPMGGPGGQRERTPVRAGARSLFGPYTRGARETVQ